MYGRRHHYTSALPPPPLRPWHPRLHVTSPAPHVSLGAGPRHPVRHYPPLPPWPTLSPCVPPLPRDLQPPLPTLPTAATSSGGMHRSIQQWNQRWFRWWGYNWKRRQEAAAKKHRLDILRRKHDKRVNMTHPHHLASNFVAESQSSASSTADKPLHNPHSLNEFSSRKDRDGTLARHQGRSGNWGMRMWHRCKKICHFPQLGVLRTNMTNLATSLFQRRKCVTSVASTSVAATEWSLDLELREPWEPESCPNFLNEGSVGKKSQSSLGSRVYSPDKILHDVQVGQREMDSDEIRARSDVRSSSFGSGEVLNGTNPQRNTSPTWEKSLDYLSQRLKHLRKLDDVDHIRTRVNRCVSLNAETNQRKMRKPSRYDVSLSDTAHLPPSRETMQQTRLASPITTSHCCKEKASNSTAPVLNEKQPSVEKQESRSPLTCLPTKVDSSPEQPECLTQCKSQNLKEMRTNSESREIKLKYHTNRKHFVPHRLDVISTSLSDFSCPSDLGISPRNFSQPTQELPHFQETKQSRRNPPNLPTLNNTYMTNGHKLNSLKVNNSNFPKEQACHLCEQFNLPNYNPRSRYYGSALQPYARLQRIISDPYSPLTTRIPLTPPPLIGMCMPLQPFLYSNNLNAMPYIPNSHISTAQNDCASDYINNFKNHQAATIRQFCSSSTQTLNFNSVPNNDSMNNKGTQVNNIVSSMFLPSNNTDVSKNQMEKEFCDCSTNTNVYFRTCHTQTEYPCDSSLNKTNTNVTCHTQTECLCDSNINKQIQKMFNTDINVDMESEEIMCSWLAASASFTATIDESQLLPQSVCQQDNPSDSKLACPNASMLSLTRSNKNLPKESDSNQCNDELDCKTEFAAHIKYDPTVTIKCSSDKSFNRTQKLRLLLQETAYKSGRRQSN